MALAGPRKTRNRERRADFRVGGPRFLSDRFSYPSFDPLYPRGRGDRGAPIKLKPMAFLSRIVARGTYGHASTSGKSVAVKVWRALPSRVDDLLWDAGQTYGYAYW